LGVEDGEVSLDRGTGVNQVIDLIRSQAQKAVRDSSTPLADCRGKVRAKKRMMVELVQEAGEVNDPKLKSIVEVHGD
jgi:hypothetical protein